MSPDPGDTAPDGTTEGLRESEQRFRLLSEASFEGVAIHDQGTLLAVNQALADMFGYSPDALIGMSILDLSAPESRDTILANVREEREDAYEGLGLRRDGSTFPVQVRGRTAPYQGRTVRIVAIRDITEHKMVEQELRWALDAHRDVSARLRELDEMKRTFLWAVSHELRTPLAAVLWVGEALAGLKDGLSEDEVQELIGMLVTNARSLDRLLTDLLDLGQLERGLEAAAPADVADVVRRAIAASAALEGSSTEVTGDPVVAAVDAPTVERIVENLVVNAHRHTPPGTVVLVRVAPDPGGVLIAVDDDGPGVPDAQKESIFEPFHRGAASSATPKGLGIGLSLVRRFAELHCGRAWVQDRPAGGASFRVLLPTSPTLLLPEERDIGARPDVG
jgi:PAS domain S-box-containing protein